MNVDQPTARPNTVLTYETDDQTLSESVVAAVAAVADTHPARLAPLAESVDPDALDALFADRHDGTPRAPGRVEIAFAGYHVVVDSDGFVSVFEES